VFDQEALRRRGLDPALAEYFRDSARFSPGQHWVSLLVNGRPQGRALADFDARGHLCFTRSLLEVAMVALPRTPPGLPGCIDLLAVHPQTHVTLMPDLAQVELVLPASALRAQVSSVNYQAGGSAGLFNYDLLGLSNESSGQSSRYLSAATEWGVNLDNTLLRSRQVLTSSNGRMNFQQQQIYAQRTQASRAATAQAGQINLLGSAFSGTAITGIQWFPEVALRPSAQRSTPIQGIANGPARVEVRQGGALIHDTLVPAGPFALTGLTRLNGRSDLQVTVIEEDGARRSFTVPLAALAVWQQDAPGLSAGLGRVRSFGKGQQTPLLATASQGWNIGPRSLLSGGLMVTDGGYQASALTFNTRLGSETSFNASSIVSSAAQDLLGGRVSLGLTTRPWPQLALSANWQGQSRGYREVSDGFRTTSTDEFGRPRQQLGLSLGWADQRWGNFTVGHSHTELHGGSGSQYLTSGWSHRWGALSLNVNGQRSVGGRRNDRVGEAVTSSNDTSVVFSATLALGRHRSVRASLNQQGDRARLDTTYSDRHGQSMDYRLNASRDLATHEQRFTANLGWTGTASRNRLGYSRTDHGQNYSGQISGGAAIHGGGVTFSPHQLGDTFGVAKVGDLSGVQLQTPDGVVRTDRSGHAVIARINAYQPTQISVQTASLPRTVDIDNGHRAVTAGRGSVQRLDFGVTAARRVMFRLTDSDGQPIAKGLTLLDEAGRYVTTVVNEGKVFVNDYQVDRALRIQLDATRFCSILADVPAQADPLAYYETIAATCVAEQEPTS
jgi:outer membrane usher protein FimD/PapC